MLMEFIVAVIDGGRKGTCPKPVTFSSQLVDDRCQRR